MSSEATRIPAAGGEVILASDNDRRLYDNFHFAAARRSGEFLYISGVIAGPMRGESNDVAAFKDQLRRAFRDLEALLKGAGAGFADVTMINTFHVWETPSFAGSKRDQVAAFVAVKDEFMPPPHSAWTAVGTSGLVLDSGIVEIQMIARVPG